MSRKIAVVGTGSMGRRYLTLLQSLEGVQPMAIPKRVERREGLRSQGFVVASSLKEASDQGARLAIIASNTGCHAGDALDAIACGMDLLVEKPLSIDAKSAQTIDAEAKKNKKKLFVACLFRFSKSLQIFREWLPKIGKVYSVRIECQSFLPDWRPNRPYQESYSASANEGGVLRDLIHEIDYALWLFGAAHHVRGRLKNIGILGIAAEEFAEIGWETERGTSLSLCLDYLSRVPRRKMSAFGEKGVLEWDGISGKTRLQLVASSEEAHPDQTKEEMVLEQTKEFLKACDSTEPSHRLVSGWEGIQALRICDAARKNN